LRLGLLAAPSEEKSPVAAGFPSALLTMPRITNKEREMAKCPYCKQAITLEKTKRESSEFTEEVHKEVSGVVKKEIMYSCPHCESVLGFGFFMGGFLTGRP
jgi:hypothetical protein